MSTVDLHTLTGAYALGALSGQEAAEFERHLVRCPACDREVRELRETAARLAVAVAEVPPAQLRTRVMAALPGVRQLPPVRREAAVVPLRRRLRNRLPQFAVAACLAAALAAGGLALDARHDADQQRDSAARAEQRASTLSALMAAPDASFHTTALKGGGTATLVASERQGRSALVYDGLPDLPQSRVYQLWYSRGGTMVPAGLLIPSGSGGSSGATLLTGTPRGADGVGVTVEPAGGSTTPTGKPLALLPV
ncbi:anti-sigma factor domain-containing protein [Streptomyces sp. NPDC057654]|uniref:anti-sigma factor n=1 Tax=Streptomyces sp. NPDC057654 TaxID=3346196 RepID=UPI00368B2A82